MRSVSSGRCRQGASIGATPALRSAGARSPRPVVATRSSSQPVGHRAQLGGQVDRHCRLVDARLGVGGLDAQHAGGTIGLEVDAPDQLAVEEERQHVVAVDALGRWRVDLDAVAEAEEPLRPLAVPDQRVERAEQRPSLHPARQRGVPVHVGGLAPAVDARRREDAVGDELGDQRLARHVPLAVVVGEIAERGDTERPGGDREQLLARLGLGRRRRRQRLRRQQPLGEVVEPGEVVAPPAGGDEPVVEEVLEGDLAVVPVPPRCPSCRRARRGRPP